MLVLILLTVSLQGFEDAPGLTAPEIMRRVAENQDREQETRKRFVYEQKLHRTMRQKDGKLLREEFWTFTVLPGPKGTEKKLLSVKGRYLKKGKYYPFEGTPIPAVGGLEISFYDDSDPDRDGIDKDLFPLTSAEQKNYRFELTGERAANGRQAYQIRFRPIDRNDYGWTGQALIDKEEFQPITVYTKLSRKLPLAVRTALGTDVPGIGYNIQYTRVDKDLWFPSSYGTEFSVRLLFFMNRTFTESTENTNFRRAVADSQIEFANDSDK